MPKPRKQLIALDATSYYHCSSRCVRRAFLCGVDHYTGQSYEHRREWVEDRILQLGRVFAIDVCAYAVMSNHLHLVLHINKAEALALTDKQICERWHQVYKGTMLTQKYARGEQLSKVELQSVTDKLNQWRLQLCDISWFMRALNEPIARMANAEDGCTGKFWEARFSSQALLDEKALASCMAYVDLNPVRAKLSTTPENSEHTSVKHRIEYFRDTHKQSRLLAQFVGNPREPMPAGLPFRFQDYLELVDWTGRILREDKRGFIPSNLPPILERLDIDAERWLVLATQFEQRCKHLVGETQKLRNAAEVLGYQRTPGLSCCRALFR